MQFSQYLAHRLREVYLDGRWIANTNLKEQLQNIPIKEATFKVKNLNTIAELVFHLNYYLEGLIKVYEGGPLSIKDKDSFSLPPVQSETEWKKLAGKLINNAETFAGIIERMNEGDFFQPFVLEKYGNNLRNIEGIIEHSYYHFGQIVLLRKLIAETHLKDASI